MPEFLSPALTRVHILHSRPGASLLILGYLIPALQVPSSFTESIPVSPCDLTTLKANLVSSVKKKVRNDFEWQKDKELL